MSTTNKKKKNKVEYGNVDLPPDEFKKPKWRVSMFIDQDVIDKAKEQASKEGIGYQTWLNQKLRETVLQEEGLASRVSKLEKAVFRKNAS